MAQGDRRQGTAQPLSQGAANPADEADHHIPKSLGELGAKIAHEGRAGKGIGGKLKGALKELDRDISGEYERRQEERAVDKLSGEQPLD
jgi:hypothetical protein